MIAVPVKYEPFEAKKVPDGAPPAHGVVVVAEQATGNEAELRAYPEAGTAQVVVVAMETQLVKI